MIVDLFAGPGGCVICGGEVAPDSRGVTCSRSCRARLREARKTTEWRKPKRYPAELVERVRQLYVGEGMSIVEVQAAVGKGVKVQRLMENHGIPRRKPVPRNQRGERNNAWVGDSATYAAVHMRLLTTFGPAANYSCVDCGRRAEQWAYDYGCPEQREDAKRGCLYSPDLMRYSPRCVPCHQRQDRERDDAGRFVRKEVMPHV